MQSTSSTAFSQSSVVQYVICRYIFPFQSVSSGMMISVISLSFRRTTTKSLLPLWTAWFTSCVVRTGCPLMPMMTSWLIMPALQRKQWLAVYSVYHVESFTKTASQQLAKSCTLKPITHQGDGQLSNNVGPSVIIPCSSMLDVSAFCNLHQIYSRWSARIAEWLEYMRHSQFSSAWETLLYASSHTLNLSFHVSCLPLCNLLQNVRKHKMKWL